MSRENGFVRYTTNMHTTNMRLQYTKMFFATDVDEDGYYSCLEIMTYQDGKIKMKFEHYLALSADYLIE